MYCSKPTDIIEKLSYFKPTCFNENELRLANLTFYCSGFFIFFSNVLFLSFILFKNSTVLQIYNDRTFFIFC